MRERKGKGIVCIYQRGNQNKSKDIQHKDQEKKGKTQPMIYKTPTELLKKMDNRNSSKIENENNRRD